MGKGGGKVKAAKASGADEDSFMLWATGSGDAGGGAGGKASKKKNGGSKKSSVFEEESDVAPVAATGTVRLSSGESISYNIPRTSDEVEPARDGSVLGCHTARTAPALRSRACAVGCHWPLPHRATNPRPVAAQSIAVYCIGTNCSSHRSAASCWR
jgi:hypothetical protein